MEAESTVVQGDPLDYNRLVSTFFFLSFFFFFNFPLSVAGDVQGNDQKKKKGNEERGEVRVQG